MRAFIKRNRHIIVKSLPGLLLILFSFFMLAYYPKNNSLDGAVQVSKTTPHPILFPNKLNYNQFYQYYIISGSNPNSSSKAEIKKLEKKARKKINYKSSVPYKVKINRTENFVMIYGINVQGKYKIPYKCFICSTAKNTKNTLLGHYRLNERYRWHNMVDGSYTQYAIRFYDKLMLHSVPYSKKSPSTLHTKEYNKLGSSASHGCIRMRVADIKWIYDHCRPGTEITIYDRKDEQPPIPYEEIRDLEVGGPNSHWDPTDPSKKNPWKK